MPRVVDIVVAVEALSCCTGSNGECHCRGELGPANACVRLISMLRDVSLVPYLFRENHTQAFFNVLVRKYSFTRCQISFPATVIA